MLPLLVLLAAAPEIPAPALKAHVEFLASDLLEGRETGTRGYDIAAAYVAAQLAAAGLEPAGRQGFLDPVSLASSRVVAEKSTACLGHGDRCEPLVHRKGILLSPDTFRDESDVEAPLVFAGFGVSAPELKHDDYAGLDVRGKIVVVLTGAPKRFAPTERAYHGHSSVKAAAAVARGAVGLLSVRTLESEKRYPWARFATLSSPVAMRATIGDVPLDAFPELRVTGTLSREAAASAWAGAGEKLDAVLATAEGGEPKPSPLATFLRAHVTSSRAPVRSANVAGLLRGSDPARAGEYVVVSAHLDHLGLLDTGEDRVRNGALDNGSGSAALIEIARALAAGPRPARSVLFLAVTAEEKGLQGSRAFAEDPSLPREAIVADVNMDMLTAIFPLKSLIAMGAEHSTLGPLAAAAAKSAGWELVDEMEPEEAHFVRSDQFSFVRKGIPALAFRAAPFSSDPKLDAAALHVDWRRNVYHSARDEASQRIDYPSMSRWAQANLELVRAIADAAGRPRWNEGDFLGRMFAPGR